MQQALTLAKRGRLTVSPNPMVGCIIVKNGQIIAEGWHNVAGENHAEINALSQAGAKAKGATVYVSLEPCCHNGRTGPCTKALITAQVKKVVIATLDPNPKVTGKGMQKLIDAGIAVEIGILEKQASELNTIFFKYQKQHKPYVFAKWAMSLDGRISVNGNDSKQISSSDANVYTHQLRNICDAIIIGKNTLIADNPQLNVRLVKADKILNPIRFVVFSKFEKIDMNWQILNQSQAKTIFICSEISDSVKDILKRINIDFWQITNNNKNYFFETLLTKMADIGITSLLVEGGMKLLNSFIDVEMVDEFVSYVSPVLIANNNPKKNLIFKNVKNIGKDIFINAKPKENK